MTRRFAWLLIFPYVVTFSSGNPDRWQPQPGYTVELAPDYSVFCSTGAKDYCLDMAESLNAAHKRRTGNGMSTTDIGSYDFGPERVNKCLDDCFNKKCTGREPCSVTSAECGCPEEGAMMQVYDPPMPPPHATNTDCWNRKCTNNPGYPDLPMALPQWTDKPKQGK